MTDFMGYRSKRVVVSGCFSGMGEATAKLLLSLGAQVHGLDYKDSALPLASFTRVDLREPASIDAAVQRIGGRVDALFNCAGLPQTFAPLEVMKVNYAGTRFLTERMLPLMAGGGAVVSIASTAGFGWSRRVPVIMELLKRDTYAGAVEWCEANLETVGEGYSLSKEAMIVWTMMSAAHLIKRGIRLNCTLPGPTQTPMMSAFESKTAHSVIAAATQPINRRSTPEEQAGPLVFLNSDAASYVNGVAFPVDGGFIGGVATGQVDVSAMMAGGAQRSA
ncbi:MAG TPA: coniferyl-alcohol dehydrogenase [Steroidobacteraceae bacterium]|nr:coniferyl-alcohol dehydrogenase [Steroidobacteraceae bacterium]